MSPGHALGSLFSRDGIQPSSRSSTSHWLNDEEIEAMFDTLRQCESYAEFKSRYLKIVPQPLAMKRLIDQQAANQESINSLNKELYGPHRDGDAKYSDLSNELIDESTLLLQDHLCSFDKKENIKDDERRTKKIPAWTHQRDFEPDYVAEVSVFKMLTPRQDALRFWYPSKWIEAVSFFLEAARISPLDGVGLGRAILRKCNERVTFQLSKMGKDQSKNGQLKLNGFSKKTQENANCLQTFQDASTLSRTFYSAAVKPVSSEVASRISVLDLKFRLSHAIKSSDGSSSSDTMISANNFFKSIGLGYELSECKRALLLCEAFNPGRMTGLMFCYLFNLDASGMSGDRKMIDGYSLFDKDFKDIFPFIIMTPTPLQDLVRIKKFFTVETGFEQKLKAANWFRLVVIPMVMAMIDRALVQYEGTNEMGNGIHSRYVSKDGKITAKLNDLVVSLPSLSIAEHRERIDDDEEHVHLLQNGSFQIHQRWEHFRKNGALTVESLFDCFCAYVSEMNKSPDVMDVHMVNKDVFRKYNIEKLPFPPLFPSDHQELWSRLNPSIQYMYCEGLSYNRLAKRFPTLEDIKNDSVPLHPFPLFPSILEEIRSEITESLTLLNRQKLVENDKAVFRTFSRPSSSNNEGTGDILEGDNNAIQSGKNYAKKPRLRR